jgi:hypothetical protein
MTVIGADPIDAPELPLDTGVHLVLRMPRVEINVEGLVAGREMTQLELADTTLTVDRHLDRRVDVDLGIGSLTAVDLVTNTGRMVWSEAAELGRKLIKLHVMTRPDEQVTVKLDLDRVNVALQRRTTLEIAAFSEMLGKEIDALVPSQLRSKVERGGDATSVEFTLQTRDLKLGLCRGGRTFLDVVMAASRVRIANAPQHTLVELYPGSLTVDDLLCEGPYRRILATSGAHSAEIRIETFDAALPNFPGHELSVVARVSSLEFVVVMPVLCDLSSYFAELGEMWSLLRAKAGRAATDALRSTVRASLDIELQSCLLLVPVTLTQPECFEAHVGRIALLSPVGKPMVAVVSGTAVKSSRFLGSMQERIGGKYILHEWSGSVAVARRGVAAASADVPDLAVSCDADSLKMQIDEEQVFWLFGLLENNAWKAGRYESHQSVAALDTTFDRVREHGAMSTSLDLSCSAAVVANLSAAPSSAAVPPPVWVKVQVAFRELSLDVGTGRGVPLCSLRCHGLALALDASSGLKLSLALRSAQLLDSRPNERPATTPLLASAQDSSIFEMTLVQAPDQFDDLSLFVGSVRVILDPSWLLTLFHVLLPILDRVLHLREASTRSEAHDVSIRAGMHLLLKICNPQVAMLEDEHRPQSRAMVLSAAHITLERTEGPDLAVAMDLNLQGIEVWKTRMATDERASIVFPLDVSVALEEVPELLSTMMISVGVCQVDFSYQDLILSVLLGEKWSPWLKDPAQAATDILDPVGEGTEDATPQEGAAESCRLELHVNRAYAAHVEGFPHPSLALKRRTVDREQQLFRFEGGRVLSDGGSEAEWCLTVEYPPAQGASVYVAQVHGAKAQAQLWDWLPFTSGGSGVGRLVLHSHPTWCASVIGGGGLLDKAAIELQPVGDGEDGASAMQLWHVPPRLVSRLSRAMRSSLNLSDSMGGGESATRALSPATVVDLQRKSQALVMPKRWSKPSAPPDAQNVSLHLLGGVHLRLVDDLAGNVRPIARVRLQETVAQVSNWSNGMPGAFYTSCDLLFVFFVFLVVVLLLLLLLLLLFFLL